jgi:1-aminocyclopropane-1-carboxylate deaminase/D-cysteine desulfhydrase-like pyridoxal-dependent ACC family enzyme
MLADEIAEDWVKLSRLDTIDAQHEKLVVVLPGGTGSTAFYLAKHLHPRNIQVGFNVDKITKRLSIKRLSIFI